MAKIYPFKQNDTKISYNLINNIEIRLTLILEIRDCLQSALIAYIMECLYMIYMIYMGPINSVVNQKLSSTQADYCRS